MVKIISILIILIILNACISYKVCFEYYPEFNTLFMLTSTFLNHVIKHFYTIALVFYQTYSHSRFLSMDCSLFDSTYGMIIIQSLLQRISLHVHFDYTMCFRVQIKIKVAFMSRLAIGLSNGHVLIVPVMAIVIAFIKGLQPSSYLQLFIKKW
jgi:hypothetical protein